MNVEDNKWEIPTPDVADDCSYCDDRMEEPVFIIRPEVLAVARMLCERLEREWQMLLVGEETDNGIFVSDYIIPEQETSLVTVTNKADITKEYIEDNKVIATMHSHNNMGVSFSKVDEQCTNFSSIAYHIVTNNDGKFKAIARKELPCGLVTFMDAIVRSDTPMVEEIKGFENIKEHKSLINNGHNQFLRGNGRNHAFDYKQGGGYPNDF